MQHPIDQILTILHERGDASYFGEAVTQTEHLLQTATLAERDGAAPALISAALLHDIGHLLHDFGEHAADQGIDSHHEALGAEWLQCYFGAEVTEPVRLHVAAKRYLCHAEASYLAGLSAASRQSLELQGGPMTAAQSEQFLALPHARAAVALRRWDDMAKIVGATTPPLAHFRAYLAAALSDRFDPGARPH